MLTHYNHQQLFGKYTKKFHHHGVFKCTNYFSSFLFQQHTEVLQQNKKEKYREHIAFLNSYFEKYTKNSIIKDCISVQINFPVFYCNSTLRCYNRIEKKNKKKFHHPWVFECSKKILWTYYICLQLLRKIYKENQWSRSKKVFKFLFLSSISTTHWGVTIE